MCKWDRPTFRKHDVRCLARVLPADEHATKPIMGSTPLFKNQNSVPHSGLRVTGLQVQGGAPGRWLHTSIKDLLRVHAVRWLVIINHAARLPFRKHINRKDSYWVWPISGTSIGFRVTATIFDYPLLTGNLHGRSKIPAGLLTVIIFWIYTTLMHISPKPTHYILVVNWHFNLATLFIPVRFSRLKI